jgi:outer membrane protein OmpA-like peptidoglycan-associated protein
VPFDSGSAQIKPDVERNLRRFKKTALRCGVHKIVLDAHIDAAEVRSNPALDRRRAEAVRDFLLDPALPIGSFSIVNWGYRDPLVPTQDGVAEPQNRRVMIRVRG